jgi:hypothetical protein
MEEVRKRRAILITTGDSPEVSHTSTIMVSFKHQVMITNYNPEIFEILTNANSLAAFQSKFHTQVSTCISIKTRNIYE